MTTYSLSIDVQEQIKSTVESDKEFAVNFEDAWQWLEYSRKDAAKRVLVDNFEESVDYIVLHNIVESVNHSTFSPQVKAASLKRESIYLTKDCFKQLAMLANTEKGKEVRLYFLQCEKELKVIKAAQPQLPRDYLTALKALVSSEEEKQKLALEAAKLDSIITELKPKADIYDIISNSGQNLKLGEVAKILGVKNMGPINIFGFLRDESILMFNNVPYQKYIDAGYFVCVEKEHRDKVYIVTLATPKGVEYIIKRFEQAGYTVPRKNEYKDIELAA